MNKKQPKAIHENEITLGDKTIPCAVLDDGTRILRERSVANSLGRKGGGAHWQKKKEEKGTLLPEYLAVKNIDPFIGDELRKKLLSPIIYTTKSGSEAQGLSAELLPEICNVWLEAREKGALTPPQEKVAKNAEILMRGLAHVGIIALVDEATGYQYERAKTALAEILENFIAKEIRPWVKTFPDDFYAEMFRLKGWQYIPVPKGKPAVVGKYTNDIVYARIAPLILDELKKVTPKDSKGRYKARLHQSLTENIGYQKLKEHLAAVTALMRASANWTKFKSLLNRALPRYDETMPLDFKDLD